MKRSILISLFVALMLTGFAFGQGITIDGPKNAGVGELCVFNLTSDVAVADWQIVPQTEFYVDSSKQTLVFSTPRAGNYTIIAATILDGNPLVLTHACSYGTSPSPNPQPEPDPQPEPQPEPPKPLTLRDWVAQNIPADGKNNAKYLADCYDIAASGMERGTIRSIDAAYASVRTSSQTKVSNKVWGGFFDGLSQQVDEKLGSGNTKDLATLYRQIAQGLRGDTVSAIPQSRSSMTIPLDNCPTGTCPLR